MKLALKVLGGVLLLIVLAVSAGIVWATISSNRILARTIETHRVDFPIPFPLPEEEVAALGLTEEEAAEMAAARAIERGRHLIEARYGCTECHGADLGGGVMIDDAMIGTLLGPNITTGEGSRTLDYTPADWDRIVRHGVRPDGTPAAMPAEDFRMMSDQELSDLIVYIGSMPPRDNTVAPPQLGPLGKVLLATGQLPLSADLIGTHDTPHPTVPPPAEASVEFGQHLAATCTGCHQMNFAGGPIPGGDPSWPPARNLTPHPNALGSWTYEDFVAALREGTRPDGTPLRAPMTFLMPYARKMTDVEIRAIWMYLQSLDPVAPPPGA